VWTKHKIHSVEQTSINCVYAT